MGDVQDLDIESQQSHVTPTTLFIPATTTTQKKSLWKIVYLVLKASWTFLPVKAVIYTQESETTRRLELTAPILGRVSEEEAAHLEEISIDTVSASSATSVDASLQRTRISKIVRTRDLGTLRQFGGVLGIAEALNTDLSNGIPAGGEDLLSRRSPQEAAASRTEASSPGFFGSLLCHCNDWNAILLLVAAVLYIGFGVKTAGKKTGWCPGTVIILAVVILVLAPTLHDLWLRRLAAADLDEQKIIHVFRGGLRETVPVSEVVPGDVVWLNEGCSLIPADGLFISGDFLVVSDGLEASVDEESPFLFHGSTVSHGSGRMLVTAVGTHTELGEAMSESPAGDCRNKAGRLPSQLDKLRKATQIACLTISILIIALLLCLVLAGGNHARASPRKPSLPEVKSKPLATHKIMEMIERILMSPAVENVSSMKAPLAVLVLGVLEGMPFVIALAAMYLLKKMLAGKVSAAGLLDCVKMGSATTIITDKTPLSPIDVMQCFVGGVDMIIQTGSVGEMPVEVREALIDGISTPLVVPSSSGRRVMVEDPTVNWAGANLEMTPDESRRNRTVMKTKRLCSSEEEGSRVLMMKKRKRIHEGRVVHDQTMVLHCKGPATTVLGLSLRYYDINGEIKDFDDGKRREYKTKIEEMKNNGLKAVAFACKTIGDPSSELDETGLILIAILGLSEHRCGCTNTRKALRAFLAAGAKIVLVSEHHDASKLEQIAVACRIFPPDGLVTTGEDFISLDPDDVGRISVIGNANPSHRLLLIRRLKERGNIVVMLGTRTSEASALKEADLGVAMGEWSSAAARESSSVVIRDGRLSSLAAVMLCGRCIYGNIQKYIQLEIVTNIAGTLVSSVTTLWLGSSPIAGIQLIWTSLAVTVLAGPALLLEPPPEDSGELMSRPSVGRSEPLISRPMWRNIAVQSLYQTTLLVGLHFKGSELASIEFAGKDGKAMVFNAFFLCQVFNLVSSREIERKNFLAGIHRNRWFPAAVAVVVALQAGFIEVAHAVVDDAKLDLKQWCVCLLIGLCSWPVDFAAKCVWDFFVKNRNPNPAATTVQSGPSDSINNLELPLMAMPSSSSIPS